jgi:hypothetical protein
VIQGQNVHVTVRVKSTDAKSVKQQEMARRQRNQVVVVRRRRYEEDREREVGAPAVLIVGKVRKSDMEVVPFPFEILVRI